MRKIREKNILGMMTVEASLIMSIVLFAQLLLIRTMLLQYDRCILNQDMERLALKYGYTQETQADAKLAYMIEQAGDISTDDYIWLTPEEPVIQIRNGLLRLQASGGAENSSYTVDLQVITFRPPVFLREARRLKGSAEQEGQKEE